MNDKKSPWQTLDSRHIYDNPWINVTEYDVINPGGGKGIYGKVSFKNIAIGIIPLDIEMNTWLVGQYRYTLNEYSWEIPMGGGPVENDILDSAKRELKEETGLTAGKWENILKLHTSNSVTDEVGYCFLARDLTEGERELDETEQDLKLRKLPFKKVLKMAEQGDITDALSLVAIYKVARILKI